MHLVYNKVFLLISGEATQEKKNRKKKMWLYMREKDFQV